MVATISNQSFQKTNLYADSGNTASVVPIKPSTKEAPQYDSVSFSSKNKKEGFFQRHWGKLLLGAAAIAAGIVLTKGKLWAKPQAQSLEKIHQNLAEIFGKKDLTKEQAETMLKKYREISQIKDKTEYIKQLFAQVKQDFGYGDNKNIYLVIRDEKIKFADIPKKKGVAGFCQNNGALSIESFLDKQNIFTSMFHEFTHVRQDEIAFRTIGAREKTVEKGIALIKREVPELYKKDPDAVAKMSKDEADKLFEARKRVFGDLPKFKEGSEEDILGKKYIEADYNYVDADKNVKEYKNNLLEQEAYRITDLAKEVFRHISR